MPKRHREDDDFDVRKTDILDLYLGRLGQRWQLRDVIAEMERVHGFKRT